MPAQSAMTGYLNCCSSLGKLIGALLALCWLTIAQAYSPPTTPTQLVIVDAEVADGHLLTTNLPSSVAVIQLQQNDTVASLEAKLTAYSQLQSVHIFSHAIPGELRLAGATIQRHDLADYANLTDRLRAILAPNGELLLYGCELAKGDTGTQFLTQLRQQSQLIIAASDDLTGAAELGGDWDLENRSGGVQTPYQVTAFSGLLTSSFVSVTNPLTTAGATTDDGSVRFVAAIDYDGDGDTDIIGGIPGGYNLFQNNGSGVFSMVVPNVTLPDVNGAEYIVADFDNDGDQDIYAPGGYFRNNGDSTFTSVTNPLSTAGAITDDGFTRYVTAINYDADSDIDFIAYNGSDYALYRNNGAGVFTQVAPNVAFPVVNGSEFVIADYNNDGFMDVFAPGGFFLNNGDGTFTSTTNPLTTAGATTDDGWTSFTAVIDYDADGDTDFIADNTGNYGYYINNGSGGFSFLASAVALPSVNGNNFLSFDYDNDGDDDLFAPTLFLRHDGTVGGTNHRPPRLTSSTPADNATAVAVTDIIVLVFDELISSASSYTLRLYRSSDDSLVESIAANSGQVTGTGSNTLTINPTTTLDASTDYYLQITLGALLDADGMAYKGIQNSTTLNFTTAGAGVLLDTNPTLTFTTNSADLTTDDIAEDGEGGSTTITDIDIQITAIDSGINQLNDLMFVNYNSQDLLVYEDGMSTANYGMRIRSADGSNFSLQSFGFHDWGGYTGDDFTVEGFDNGSSTGSINFAGNTTGVTISLALGNELTASKFQNIDEVRIYKADNSDSWFGINHVQVGSPVVAVDNPPQFVGNFMVHQAVYSGDAEKFSVAAQGTDALDMTFNADGTAMFVLDFVTRKISKYTLSTAYDVSTASFAGAPAQLTVSAQDTNPTEIAFNNDGSKLYMLGQTGDKVYQYNLGTAFEPSTATYLSATPSFVTEEGDANGMDFNADGSKMFVLGYQDDRIYEYDLSTPFDVSTATYAGIGESFAINEDTFPLSMAFNNTGTELYVLGYTSKTIYKFNLSAPYDVSTAVNAGAGYTINISAQESLPFGLTFDPSGSKMFITGWNSDAVNEYAVEQSTVAVAEGTSGVITDIHANNGDSLELDTGLTYSLSGDDAALFSINSSTGVISLSAAADYENPADADTDNNYQLTVTANDGVNSTNLAITVTITDVLDTASVASTAASAISYTVATLNGNITSDNGNTITARGFVISSLNNQPLLNGANVTDLSVAGTSTGTYDRSLTGLSVNTLYYFRAYVTTAGGTAYGNVLSFSTIAAAAPSISTSAATDVLSSSANLNGTISADGGDTITASGFVYSSSDSTPELSEGGVTTIADGATSGSFSEAASGLTGLTTYYYQAFATNSVGTTYGGVAQFTTLNPDSTAPTVASLLRSNPSTLVTSADSLTWQLTFDETVIEVDATDFSLSGTTASLSVMAVSGAVYDVTASGGDLAGLNGTVTLAFAGGQNITDSAANPLTNTTPTGGNEASFELDNGGPVISGVSIANNALKIGDEVTVTITVDTDTDSYSLVTGTVAGFTLANLTKVNDTTYTATFTVTAGSDIAGGTDLAVSLVLQDSNGNNSATYDTAISQGGDAIDATRPTITSLPRQTPVSYVTNADSVIWQLNLSEQVSGLDVADIVVNNTTATVTAVSTVNGQNWLLTVSGGDLASLNNEIYLTLAAGYSVSDLAGNSLISPVAGAYIPSSDTYVIDNTVPTTPFDLGLEVTSDCGVSTTDRKTNDNTPTVLGKTETFGVALVNLYRDGNVPVGSTDQLDCGAWGITTSGLADGVHQLTAIATDSAGNVSATSAALEVLIDTVLPSATANVTAVTQANDAQTSYQFSVTYADASSGVDVTSLSGSIVSVTGPNAFSGSATVDSISGNVVTYSMTAPGGQWDVADVGTYTLAISGSAVADIAGNLLANNANLAEFNVIYNSSPTIGGTPATTATQGVAYSFIPEANDVDADTTLTFSISNKPTWASFDAATGALTGTPGNSDVGDYTGILISVSDGIVSTDLATFSINVANVNDAPTVTGTPATTATQGVAYSFTPVAADIDAATTLTFSISNKPAWASFDPATGTLTGTPGNSDVGSYPNILISVSDGELSATLASFNITVNNINDAPTISGTPATTATQGVAYSFTPVASDIDASTTLTFSISNKPVWATFDTATGTLSGTPGNSDVGVHSNIVITVSDGDLTANLAAFNISVSNVNDAPTIGGIPSTTATQGVAYSFIPEVEDVDSDTVLTFSISNKPAWATFDTSTGALTGTPQSTDVGSYSNIVISVSDGELSTELAAFTIVVGNTNDAPTISGTPATTATQGVAYSFTPEASDIDESTTLIFSISNKPAWLTFDASTGALTGTPGNSDVGSHNNIGISVSDGALSAALPAFNITVANVNDAPTISGTPATTATQGVAYSFVPVAADIDVATTLTFSISNKPAWANFDTSTGALTGTPGNSDVGSYNNIVISVSDGEVSVDLATFSITVGNSNDAPTISGTPATTATQGVVYSFTPVASDIDESTTLVFSISNKPTWLTFDASTGALTGTPGNSDVGSHNAIGISVSDGALSAALPAFNITVANVNDAPTISGTPATTATQGVAYSFVPVAADIDVATTLTFSISNKPAWANFDTSTGALTGTPGNSDVGSYSDIVISVSDGELSVALATFSITVGNSNDAPVITGAPASTIAQNSLYSFIPTVFDVDNDTLTFSITNQPAWAQFSTQTGALTGIPAQQHVGLHSNIVITVSDGSETASLPAFSITVTNVNDAPEISGTPVSKVKVKQLYSFTPLATDADGDTLVFSVSNKPAWATFDPATGQLTGTPSKADVGTSSGVLIQVSDGTETVALAVFSIEVVNENTAPVAQNSAVTLPEDSSKLIELQISDADGDELAIDITVAPQHGSLTAEGSGYRYVPETNYHGTDNFSFVARDDELSSESASVSLTITPVNDNPVAVADDFTVPRTANDSYTLAVLANDTDIDGDSLAIDGASASTGTVSFSTAGLIYQAPAGYIGDVGLRYTLTDGAQGRASADVKLRITGSADSGQPVITLPADVETNATALYTKVDLGVATAVDRNGVILPVSLVDNNTFFAPGEHIAYWQATDSQGNKATKGQRVIVNPLISLSKDAAVTEGSVVTVQVILNGPAPSYPVLVPYSVSGTADGNDHSLVDGVVELTSGTTGVIQFNVFEDALTEGNETISIALDPSLNLGSQAAMQITIREDNITPTVSLSVNQQGENRLTVDQAQGMVMVKALVEDQNPQDQLSLQWTANGIIGADSNGDELLFDPAVQLPGVYVVSTTVTDSGNPALATTGQVYIVVVEKLPALSGNDSDGDLIPDNEEGFADSDGDGIPDYLDAIVDCNVVPEEGQQQVLFLAEGPPGVCLRRGQTAVLSNSGGLQLLPDEVESDPIAQNIGGIFDFIAYGLPVPGQTYQLVLPQRLPVPANAVYRKYTNDTGWVDFVSDQHNFVSSTSGERGFCPPPGDSVWSVGLTEGHWCVQVSVQDGGPNDADGLANSAIVDPGGVGILNNGNSLPLAQPDAVTTRIDVPVEVNVLANDSDPDGDALSVTQVSAQFGQIEILADQRLRYSPAPHFSGVDRVIYSVSDSKGGTGSSELAVTVLPNNAPVVVNETATTDDRTAITLAVLSNDSDPDGDVLRIVSASAQQGTVVIQPDKSLRYQPKAGFEGTDTVSYVVADSLGMQAQGQVVITIKAYKDVIVNNKSGGGSMSGWWMGLLCVTVLWRRRLSVLAAAVLLCPAAVQASAWYGFVEMGQAKADRDAAEIRAELGSGNLLSLDQKDSAYGLGLGYQFTDVVAVELSYWDFGEAQADISNSSLTPGSYHELVKQVSPYLGEAVGVGGRFTVWQQQQWQLDITAGALNWQTEISSSMSGSTLSSSFDGTDVYYGVAAGYQLTSALTLSAQWLRTQVHQNDVDMFAARLSYRF